MRPNLHPDRVPAALRAALLAVCAAALPLVASPAQAQTQTAVAAAIGLPDLPLRMSGPVRSEVEGTLRGMDDPALSLTYTRIHATFRAFLGHDDLSVARALLDYAALTQAELARRGLATPAGADTASDMALAYELIL